MTSHISTAGSRVSLTFLSVAVIALAPLGAYAVEYKCSNKALVSKCHNDPSNKKCLEPDAMTELLEFTIRSESEFTDVSQVEATVKRLSGDLKEGFHKKYGDEHISWYPHTGELEIHFWNGTEQRKIFETVVHNWMPENYERFTHEYFHQADNLQIYGDVSEDSIFREPTFWLWVAKPNSPSGEWVFSVNGSCKLTGNSPFPERTTKKSDADSLFQ